MISAQPAQSQVSQAPPVSVTVPETAVELVEAMSRGGLTHVDHALKLAARFEPAPRRAVGPGASEAARFAKELVASRLLTSWQANQLLKGRTQGFHLGAYLLFGPIGRGAMGVVYLAEHAKMRRQVALKVLPRELVAHPDRLDLFYREAQLTASLDHPNIVRAFDVNNEGDAHYLAMEFVDGKTLAQLVSDHGPLAADEAMEAIRQAALGLAHAHDRGLIHRDIKPENIMRTVQGQIKVLDMGLAHWTRRGHEAFAGKLVGTPDYMAPEQARSCEQVDGRADVYGLGCVLRFLLTGRPPHEGQSAEEVLLAHQKLEHADIRTVREDVCDDLAAILRKMTRRDPALRYASAHEAAEAIGAWLERRRLAAEHRQAHGTSGKTVLVADDDPVSRKVLERMLSKAGYHVKSAEDGRAALDQLTPDLAACFFDLNMPRVSGMECLRATQRQFPHIPVLIVSELSELQGAVAAMREGAFDFIPKPCRQATLMSRLEEALAAGERRRKESLALAALAELSNPAHRGVPPTEPAWMPEAELNLFLERLKSADARLPIAS